MGQSHNPANLSQHISRASTSTLSFSHHAVCTARSLHAREVSGRRAEARRHPRLAAWEQAPPRRHGRRSEYFQAIGFQVPRVPDPCGSERSRTRDCPVGEDAPHMSTLGRHSITRPSTRVLIYIAFVRLASPQRTDFVILLLGFSLFHRKKAAVLYLLSASFFNSCAFARGAAHVRFCAASHFFCRTVHLDPRLNCPYFPS